MAAVRILPLMIKYIFDIIGGVVHPTDHCKNVKFLVFWQYSIDGPLSRKIIDIEDYKNYNQVRLNEYANYVEADV